MQARAAVVICDGDDSECGAWDLDYYEQAASTVGSTRITTSERAPGWTCTREGDFCPKHKPQDGPR